MYEDIIENAPFCFQLGRLLTFVHNGTFAMQWLSREQKGAFVKAVRNTVDQDYE
jgi:hypothetical protein